MKNKPSKGEIWVSETNWHVLVTDVYKKKKKESLMCHDDGWNLAKPGQVFVYTVAKRKEMTVNGRGKLEDFLKIYKFLRRADRCNCPDCEKYHVPWGLYNK